MAYEYDIFISYRNMGSIKKWVPNVLVPEIQERMDACLPSSAKIFLDKTDISPGAPWPQTLQDAHLRSKIFIMVLSWNYFSSGWCHAEWSNAVERYDQTQKQIVFPIRYNDLKDEHIEKMPSDVKTSVTDIQREDFGPFTTLNSREGDSALATTFRQTVEQFAENILCPSLEKAPDFNPKWPSLPVKPLPSRPPDWKARLS